MLPTVKPRASGPHLRLGISFEENSKVFGRKGHEGHAVHRSLHGFRTEKVTQSGEDVRSTAPRPQGGGFTVENLASSLKLLSQCFHPPGMWTGQAAGLFLSDHALGVQNGQPLGLTEQAHCVQQ